jgi:hypothetical protein
MRSTPVRSNPYTEYPGSSVVITGSPDAIASWTDAGNPSPSEGSTKTSHAR